MTDLTRLREQLDYLENLERIRNGTGEMDSVKCDLPRDFGRVFRREENGLYLPAEEKETETHFGIFRRITA